MHQSHNHAASSNTELTLLLRNDVSILVFPFFSPLFGVSKYDHILVCLNMTISWKTKSEIRTQLFDK